MRQIHQISQKTFTSARFLLILIIALFQTGIADGQCMMIPAPLGAQASKSDLIVEGVVRDKAAFMVAAGNFIYTTYQIEITKIFKGQFQRSMVQVVEEGGQVGHKVLTVTPSIELQVGQTGTFFLKLFSFRDPQDGLRFTDPVYRAYASSQSVFSYDFYRDTVDGVFNKYGLDSWYDRLTKAIGAEYTERKELIRPVHSNSRMVPLITNMSPLTITSGTFSVLTITGSGFGATMGASTIEFKNPDDGGATYLAAIASLVQTWSDIQITIKVPYRAGSGQVKITVGGVPVTSSQSLNITYSQFNLQADIGAGIEAFKRHLYNNNGMGGFTFRLHNEFYTAPNPPPPAQPIVPNARKSLERALNSWRCATQVNFIIGDATSIDVAAEDGTNVIRFDNGAELGDYTGASTYSWADDCAAGSPYYFTHVTEIDMVINDGFPAPYFWNYGPGAPNPTTEIDFETAIVHEFGHATCLGHIINTPDVMNWNFGVGETKRVLSADDLAGGNYVQAQSTGNPPYCSFTPMTNYRQIKYVNISTTGSQSGDTWASAYKYLQDALAAVTTCVDTIYVANGTYYPDEGAGLNNNEQGYQFVLNSPVVMRGGYNATTGVRNLVTTPSILSGDIDLDNVTDADNSRNVVRVSGIPTIDGFIIERGYADGTSGDGQVGAGMFISTNGIIRNCVFRNNFANSGGGGGLGFGGAIYSTGATPEFHDVAAYSNTALAAGSAVYISGGQFKCIGCTIVNNLTAPAVSIISGGAHLFRNSIFWNNGTDFNVSPGAAVDVHNSILQSAGLPTGVVGINVLFNTNPLFVDMANNNLSILPCSPALNTGDNGYNNSTIDVLGNPRIVATIVDRGAFEHTTGLPPSTVVTNTSDSGAGSLRTIIANACSGNTITFAAGLLNQTILLTGTQIDINKNLTIDGLGLDMLNISANATHRHFFVFSGTTATIKNLNLIEGNSTPNGNCISSQGNLTLQNIRVKKTAAATNPITVFNNTGGILNLLNQVFVQ